MRLLRLAMLLPLLVALSGCAGFAPWNQPNEISPQEYAGCTWVERTSPDGSVLKYRDCKDKSLVRATLAMPDGMTLTYDADDVKGLKHMEQRAEVHRALTDAGVTVTGDVVDKIIRALRPIP